MTTYSFTEEQLRRVLADTIARHIAYRDVQGYPEQDAALAAVNETLQGLSGEQERAAAGEVSGGTGQAQVTDRQASIQLINDLAERIYALREELRELDHPEREAEIARKIAALTAEQAETWTKMTGEML
jgi:hypothetical protein